jgi:putative transposase
MTGMFVRFPWNKYRNQPQEYVEISNHLERLFAVTAPNHEWLGYVTYVWAGNCWAYLAVFHDLFAYSQLTVTVHQ